MKYAVTVVRTGTIWVEAATPTEAMQIADCQDTEDIDWCDGLRRRRVPGIA